MKIIDKLRKVTKLLLGITLSSSIFCYIMNLGYLNKLNIITSLDLKFLVFTGFIAISGIHLVLYNIVNKIYKEE